MCIRDSVNPRPASLKRPGTVGAGDAEQLALLCLNVQLLGVCNLAGHADAAVQHEIRGGHVISGYAESDSVSKRMALIADVTIELVAADRSEDLRIVGAVLEVPDMPEHIKFVCGVPGDFIVCGQASDVNIALTKVVVRCLVIAGAEEIWLREHAEELGGDGADAAGGNNIRTLGDGADQYAAGVAGLAQRVEGLRVSLIVGGKDLASARAVRFPCGWIVNEVRIYLGRARDAAEETS